MKTIVAFFFLTSIAVGGASFASESGTADGCRRQGDLQVTSHIEPVLSGKMLRLHATCENLGDKEIKIERFPICKYSRRLPGGEASLRFWDSLVYVPHERALESGEQISLSSEAYSSQSERGRGHVPFWRVHCGRNYVYFSLAWCGGWRAEIRWSPEGMDVVIELTPEETQLTLKPGEKFDGPAVYVTIVEADDETTARAAWLKLREEFAGATYGGPRPWLPFLYNHWYAVRADIDRSYLERQLDELDSWGFDLFVLDYGWFEKVGDWQPNRAKFQAGELEDFFSRVRAKKVKAGIWTCPWLLAVDEKNFPPEIDEPRFCNRFMKAYSLDIAGIDFKGQLIQHIADLQKTFGIVWWKYDQELFGQDSRQGKMRKVIALQDALRAVRAADPQLYIENCMSGGRMINAFTDDIAQSHWIRDGGRSGLEHAETNIAEALGAAEFLPPAKIQRWTNRPDEIDPADDELLKMYCRSAMIGVWGVSGDLTKISPRQKSVIISEAALYRRLNELKTANLYRVLGAGDGHAKTRGVVFYNTERDRAAVLLFRRQRDGAIAEAVHLDLLRNDGQYKITDADAKVDGQGETRLCAGSELAESGLPINFGPERRSAVYWIERQ